MGKVLGWQEAQHQGNAFQINLVTSFTVKHSAQLLG